MGAFFISVSPAPLFSNLTYFVKYVIMIMADRMEVMSHLTSADLSHFCQLFSERSERLIFMSCVKLENDFIISGNIVTMYTRKRTAFTFDVEFLEIVRQYGWYMNNGYIVANKENNSGLISLARLIMQPESGMCVDHIDGNPLNNCKSNLRICTIHQNCYNRKAGKANATGIVGVQKKNKSEYNAYITFNKKRINLGNFKNLDEAVKARKEAEQKYFGEYSFDNSR